MQCSAPVCRPLWSKITQKCVYGDKMFLSTISLKHPSPIICVLHIKLDTSDARMITASKYGGLYRTFYDIRNTQYYVAFLVRGLSCKPNIYVS